MSDQSAFAGQDNQDLTLIRDCLVDMDQISSKVLRQVMADIADELNSRPPPYKTDRQDKFMSVAGEIEGTMNEIIQEQY